MDIMSLLLSPEAWIAFFTLTALELVLGIDNIIFISILVDRLPRETREKARKLGLFMAMFMRIGLLLLLAWIVGATQPLFTVFGSPFSPRDLILIFGGLFLVWKSTQEVHQLLEGEEEHHDSKVKATFTAIIFQIMMIDLVFSLDSIITAVGMVKDVAVMTTPRIGPLAPGSSQADIDAALGAQCSMVVRVAGAPPMYLPRPCGRQSWRQVR